jgi:hypothetical protein
MPDDNKVAAAILACEASRQQQEAVKAGPHRAREGRDVADELWSYFELFMGRLTTAEAAGTAGGEDERSASVPQIPKKTRFE